MEADRLLPGLELVSGSGQGVTPEQSAALRTSLLLLRRNMKLRGVQFWGKILGVRGDYFLCRGTPEEEELRGALTFYSLNCLDWHLLPPATPAAIAEGQVIRGRFMGDPSHEYEHTLRRRAGEGDAAYEEEVTHIKEETRLVAAIAMISREAAVVPRGAFIRDPLGSVKVNHCFRGLTVTDTRKLSSYFHFTPSGAPRAPRSLLEKADLEPSIDFLDSLEHDIPKGCWSVQLEQGNSVVILRSLLWPGMTFYHVPLTPQHGYVYIGTGERNIDLPFMI